MIFQLCAVHAVHAGPAALHPVQLVQSLDDGCSSIQIPSVLSSLRFHSKGHCSMTMTTAYCSDDTEYNKENVCGCCSGGWVSGRVGR